MFIPEFKVENKYNDIEGRYYMLSYKLLQSYKSIVYDTEEKKFYDWDPSLTSLITVYPESYIGKYSTIIPFITIYLYKNYKMLELDSIIKSAEKAIIDSMI